MKLLLTLSLLFTGSLCLAQRQNVYFLKDNGKYVDVRDSADYVRIVRDPDSGTVLYNVLEFYLDGNKKLMAKSSAIDPPKYEGMCVGYYPNEKKHTIISYKKGSKVGESYEFYPNGELYLELSYPDNNNRGNDFDNNYLIKENTDSLGNALVTDGNGHAKFYDDKFTYIQEEGDVKDGKRNSEWKGNSENPKITFTETYNNGVLITGTAIGEDGKNVTYTQYREVPPQFKGGTQGFGRYLRNNINYPVYAREKNIQGKVILSFVVEKNGELTEVKVNKSVDPGIDAEAVRVLKQSPKWLPGTMFGKPVRVRYSVPIDFSMARY